MKRQFYVVNKSGLFFIIYLLLLMMSGSPAAAQSDADKFGYGLKSQIGYVRLTNDGGSGGIGWGAGAFLSFMLGNYFQIQLEAYPGSASINYEFNYALLAPDYLGSVSERGKEKLNFIPMTFLLNFYPKKQPGFLIGIGYCICTTELVIEKVNASATMTKTYFSTNHTTSGEVLAHGTKINAGASRIVFDAGYKFRFIKVALRFEVSSNAIISQDVPVWEGVEHYPVQHLITNSITLDIDLIKMVRILLDNENTSHGARPHIKP